MRAVNAGLTHRTSIDSEIAVEFDETRIDSIFSELQCSALPGAAVGIAIRGRPVYRKGFGLANMELPVVLAPTMRMRIGSTSKHFTSLAYMLLCEDGRAGIDDPVGKYLPDLHPVTRAITIRQLMTHVGGLRDAHEISWQFCGTGRAASSADLLSFYRDVDDVNAAPGTAWSYNNGGYLILSSVIERISGQSLESFLRERIFDPIGMFDTVLRRWDTDFVPNSASLHMTNAAGRYVKSYIGMALAGEGGIVSTVDDMLRWLAHMTAPMIGSTETWATMKTPHRLANGASTGYGLGLITNRYRGVETLFHGGGVLGGNSHMLKVPAAGLDVAIMVNRQDVLGLDLVNKILDACLPDLEPVRGMSHCALATGTFRSPITGRVIQLYAKDGQQIVSIDGYDWHFVSAENGVLRPAPIWSHLKLKVATVGDPRRPTAIRFSDFSNTDDLVAVRPPESVDTRAITGQYRSSTTGTGATISESEEGLRLVTVGRFGSMTYRLECLAEGIWRARSGCAIPWDAILSFCGDGAAFLFTTLRTRALSFRRDC